MFFLEIHLEPSMIQNVVEAEPLRRVLLQQALSQLEQLGRARFPLLSGEFGLLLYRFASHILQGALEGHGARHQVVEDDAEAPVIELAIKIRLPHEKLGGLVSLRADVSSTFVQTDLIRHAEVAQLQICDVAILVQVHQHILRFHVLVQDTIAMAMKDCLNHHSKYVSDVFLRQLVAIDVQVVKQVHSEDISD